MPLKAKVNGILSLNGVSRKRKKINFKMTSLNTIRWLGRSCIINVDNICYEWAFQEPARCCNRRLTPYKQKQQRACGLRINFPGACPFCSRISHCMCALIKFFGFTFILICTWFFNIYLVVIKSSSLPTTQKW